VGISRLAIDAADAFNGIEVTGGSVDVVDVEIVGANAAGIQLRNNSTASISDSDIINNPGNGIALENSSSADIGAVGSPAASQMITGNAGAGVLVDANSSVNLRANFIENNVLGGVVCGISGALTVEAEQDFGTGNPAGNPAGNADVDAACHVRNFAEDSNFPI
jgi:hypothetical protein